VEELNATLNPCLNSYREEFGHIVNLFLTTKNFYKVQKTMPYGGYHIWHYEQLANDQDSHNRELVWTLYLNTMPDHEAETEFLYQKTKVQPKEGTVCIFPAAMTHLHRGLTVYSYPKYIATGWYYIRE
jgi:oligoendopeptidase F